jgi:hypothetical protein
MRVERDFAEAPHMSRRSEQHQPEYLGALIEGDERRLVLVPMDPKEPWAAFRRMRSWMRDTNSDAKASLDVFAAPQRLETEAKVIPLRRRIAQ